MPFASMRPAACRKPADQGVSMHCQSLTADRGQSGEKTQKQHWGPPYRGPIASFRVHRAGIPLPLDVHTQGCRSAPQTPSKARLYFGGNARIVIVKINSGTQRALPNSLARGPSSMARVHSLFPSHRDPVQAVKTCFHVNPL